jgi:hypothetical protein
MQTIANTQQRTATRNTIPFHTAGAGRGAERMLPHLEQFNRQSERWQLVPTYIDPAPGKARTLAQKAMQQGIPAAYEEATAGEIIARDDGSTPLVLSLDRPGEVAKALRQAIATRQAILAFLLVRTPNGMLYGVRVVCSRDDQAVKEQAAVFFEALAGVVARTGSSFVFGERGKPEHLAAEPAFRAWFAQGLGVNLPKLVAGIEPEGAAVEITEDGKTAMPVLIIDHRATGWADPSELAREVSNNPAVPLLRGEGFVIAEIGAEGLRLHRVQKRHDDKVQLHGSSVIDPAGVAAMEAEDRERARREAEEAVRRAQAAEMSRSSPGFTTD